MNRHLRHLNTFQDTKNIARDDPRQWALVYVPDGQKIKPNLYENFVIRCNRFSEDCLLHLEGMTYLGTREELEPVLMAWLYVHDVPDNRPITTLKEKLRCTA